MIQSQNPSHYAFDAVIGQDLASFYRRELEFRRELGYPPFRRLAVDHRAGPDGRGIARASPATSWPPCGASSLTVYPPPAGGGRARARQVVVKGERDLPALAPRRRWGSSSPASRARGIMDVEVDPVQWPS